ncbi:MAG TPA: phosphotransferase family protein [Solirubrobacterales bacterium]|nr:phosphotransferase family protein [Solirubrobacterales bacterium]
MADEATDADGTVAAPDGIAQRPLEAWFGENVPGADLPLRFERIAGGHSNLTYRVTDAGGRKWALRRPPLCKRLGSAHDMGREFKVVSALGGTEVPVAPVVGLCEDESVNEAPFYVMEFVEGPVLRGLAEGEVFPDEADRRAIGERVADTLVQIHAVDPDAAGLGDLGRKEDYVARQLHRWQGQWEKSKTRELEAVDRVHEALSARIPEQGPATIVHGDYRLDNMILAPGADEVAAVVDWELCTLGDPLADVGLLMVYWPQRGEDSLALGMPANLAPGFPTREEMKARYAERSGRDLSQLDFFVALGYWKLAIILEGVYARYTAGGYGKVNEGVEAFARLVERLAEEAERVERGGE